MGNILALNFVDIEFVSMVLFLILFVSMTFDLKIILMFCFYQFLKMKIVIY